MACVRRDLTDFVGAADFHSQALSVLDNRANDSGLDPLRVVVLDRLGESLRLWGRYAEAERYCRTAVAIAEHLHPSNALLQAEALNGLGIVFKDTGRFAEAAEHYHRAMDLMVAQLGPDDPRLAGLLHNLAGLEHALDRFASGEPYVRRALELRGGVEAAATSVGTAGDLGVLGALLLGQGRYTEAEDVLLQALAIWRGRFGDQHYEVAVVQHNLAALYAARGQLRDAQRAYNHALGIKRNILGADHPEVTALQHHVDRLAS